VRFGFLLYLFILCVWVWGVASTISEQVKWQSIC